MMTPPVPAEDFHGSFSDGPGPSATWNNQRPVCVVVFPFNNSYSMQHAQFMGQSVHFINVFPPAGDVFAICLLLFLQFQGQVVDLLVEVPVELLILQWNTHHRPSMTSAVVTMGKTAGRQITVIHRLMTARQRCNVNDEHVGMCKGQLRSAILFTTILLLPVSDPKSFWSTAACLHSPLGHWPDAAPLPAGTVRYISVKPCKPRHQSQR